MKYKLLVLDVDGTLLNDAKEISKRTLAALLKVQQMGVRIVLASGRPTYGLMPLAKSLELGNYGYQLEHKKHKEKRQDEEVSPFCVTYFLFRCCCLHVHPPFLPYIKYEYSLHL